VEQNFFVYWFTGNKKCAPDPPVILFFKLSKKTPRPQSIQPHPTRQQQEQTNYQTFIWI